MWKTVDRFGQQKESITRTLDKQRWSKAKKDNMKNFWMYVLHKFMTDRRGLISV